MNTAGSQSITTSPLPESSGTELQVSPKSPIARATTFSPTNLTEAIAFADMIANSDLAPKDFKGKPGNVLIAMQMGAEVGLAPMQAIQNIAVINGRPSLWGDAALAVVQAHKDYEWHKEPALEGTGTARTATFIIKRRGQEPHTTKFSMADAIKAELVGKDIWKKYTDRMLQMRARGFGLRDKFADALRGLNIAEEAMDLPPIDEPVIERPAQAIETTPVIQMPTRKIAETATQTQPAATVAEESGEDTSFLDFAQEAPKQEPKTQPASHDLACSGAPDCPCKKCADNRAYQRMTQAQDQDFITTDQNRRFFAIFTKAGLTKGQVKAYLQEHYGISDDRQIQKKDYDAICAWVQRGGR